jgi:chemotaxis signal transduction protein
VRTIVRFRASDAEYALPVEDVTEVRSASELTPLPAPRSGVAGLMTHGGDALPVLSVLTELGRHVLVMSAADVHFGVLVDEVVGVERVEDGLVGPPPRGQDRDNVTGVIVEEGRLILLLDSAALGARLSR